MVVDFVQGGSVRAHSSSLKWGDNLSCIIKKKPTRGSFSPVAEEI